VAVNQQHIAEKLNISVATVSRSLKNDLSISAQTRAMVLETAQRMGYSTPTTFRQKIQSRADNEMLPVCALIQSDAQPGMAEYERSLVPGILAGMSEATAKYKTSLIVHYVPLKNRNQAYNLDMLPRMVREGMVSGMVLIHYYPDFVVKKLTENFTCASIIYDYHLSNMDIAGDNQSGAIRHQIGKLYERGHRKIAFFGELLPYVSSNIRCSAYLESILDYGLSFNNKNIFDMSKNGLTDNLIEDIISSIRNGTTAIVCACDTAAYQLMRKLINAGIRIPEDVSLTGYDADPVPAGLIKLDSIKIPCQYLGNSAVELIRQRIENPAGPARRILFDCSVINGNTIATIKP